MDETVKEIRQPARFGRYSKIIREQQEGARALESVVNRLLSDKEAELDRITAERDRYKAALEVIAGSADKLQATQAKGALTNIGADILVTK